MAARGKTVIGVIFGGRSVEHDVSIVTGQQIMQAFDKARYEVVPIFITRDGKWYTGDALSDIENFKEDAWLQHDDVQEAILSPDVRHHGLIVNPLAGRFSKSKVMRLDVIFPAIHGSHGEDGTLQGLFELTDIPYVGFATLGSALTNDKIMTKRLMQQQNIPVLDWLTVTRTEWLDNPDAVIAQAITKFDMPLFVKPATLGSSIGVNRVEDDAVLRVALDIACNFDQRVLIEPAMTEGVEINCAVMGYGTILQASVLEQPTSFSEFLAFEDKYLRGDEGMKSADRIIPAPLSDDLTQKIQDMSLQAFRTVGGRGIVRLDYLVKPETGEVYLNEMNTMPGSLAFYLWRETGLSAAQVVDKLIQAAREAHADKRRNLYDYKTNLVTVAAGRGLKGTKGSKVAKPNNN